MFSVSAEKWRGERIEGEVRRYRRVVSGQIQFFKASSQLKLIKFKKVALDFFFFHEKGVYFELLIFAFQRFGNT